MWCNPVPTKRVHATIKHHLHQCENLNPYSAYQIYHEYMENWPGLHITESSIRIHMDPDVPGKWLGIMNQHL